MLKESSVLTRSIGDIHAGFGDGSVTPVDVAEACIRAVDRLDPEYKAWVCFDGDGLRRQAEATAERLKSGAPVRALEGLPVGVKDIINTIDFPTQMGSRLWKGFTSGNDARIVYNLKNAGALIPGKTVTAEFAVHALNETVNPHDKARTPGTSSSGSAAAIALGMVPAALGTQTAGSIVRPASFCGIYGCKPSFGFIPRTGMLKTTDSLDTVGYFTRNAADLRRLFNVLRVHGPNYPVSHAAISDEARQTKPAGRPWRVALVKTPTWSNADEYAREAFLSWAARLDAAGDVDVIEVELPPAVAEAHRIHGTIYDKTLSYYFAEEFKNETLISPIMNEIIRRGNDCPVADYHRALHEQEGACRAMDEFMQRFDALISLSTAGVAPLRDSREQPDPALIWTLTHLPVISAPVFAADGLPFGLQLAARKYNDELLFRFVDHLIGASMLPPGANPALG
jgi:Asp-tRNA(Asn)/Glu-tRNA(Gln) amidotransferase A subunit family amidase